MKIKPKYFWIKADGKTEQIDDDKYFRLTNEKMKVRIIGNEVLLSQNNKIINTDKLALQSVLIN